jgi:hypothetical protein
MKLTALAEINPTMGTVHYRAHFDIVTGGAGMQLAASTVQVLAGHT